MSLSVVLNQRCLLDHGQVKCYLRLLILKHSNSYKMSVFLIFLSRKRCFPDFLKHWIRQAMTSPPFYMSDLEHLSRFCDCQSQCPLPLSV